MTNVFAVVGEHRDDPDRLLLLGDDGRYYAARSPDSQPTPVEPTEEWTVDPHAPDEAEAAPPGPGRA